MAEKKLGCIILALFSSLALALTACSNGTLAIDQGNNPAPTVTPANTVPGKTSDNSPVTGATPTSPTGTLTGRDGSPSPLAAIVPSGSPAPALTPLVSPASGPISLEKALASGKPTLADFGSTT